MIHQFFHGSLKQDLPRFIVDYRRLSSGLVQSPLKSMKTRSDSTQLQLTVADTNAQRVEWPRISSLLKIRKDSQPRIYFHTMLQAIPYLSIVNKFMNSEYIYQLLHGLNVVLLVDNDG